MKINLKNVILASSLGVLISGCASIPEGKPIRDDRDFMPYAVIGEERNNTPYEDPKGIPFYIKRF